MLRYSVWFGPARADRAARRAHFQFLGGRHGSCIRASGRIRASIHAQFLQSDVHPLGIDRLALRPHVQVLEHGFRAFDRLGHADDLESIAAPFHLDAEARLDLLQMLVQRSAQLDQADVVRRLKHELAASRDLRSREGFFHETTAQRIGHGFGDDYIAQLIDQSHRDSSARPGKLTHRLLSVRPPAAADCASPAAPPARADGADHALGNGARLAVQALLQQFQPLLLDGMRYGIGKAAAGVPGRRL